MRAVWRISSKRAATMRARVFAVFLALSCDVVCGQGNAQGQPRLSYNGRAGTLTNVVVAADGSGQFKTVQEGIQAAATGSVTQRVIVHIKPGTYKELIYIQREKHFVRLLGENPTNT